VINTAASLAASRATLVYRPVRRLYSIPHDLDLCREVVRHSSQRWGGLLDLIAVEETRGEWTPFDRQCAEAAAPDRLLVVGHTPEDELERLKLFTQRGPFDMVTFRSHRYELDAPAPIAHAELVSPVSCNPEGSLFDAMSWGDPSPSLLDLDHDMAHSARASPCPTGEKWAMPAHRIFRQALLGTTILDETAARLSVRTGSMVFEVANVLVAVAHSADIDALTYFWNLRALFCPYGIRVVPLPLWAEGEELREIGAEFRGSLGSRVKSQPEVVVHVARSDDRAPTERLITEILGLTLYTGRPSFSIGGAHERSGNVTAAIYRPALPDQELIQAEATSEYPVVVGSEMRLHIVHPSSVPTTGASVVEVIDVPDFAVPPRRTLAELIAPGARITRFGLAATGLSNGEFRVHIPSDNEVVHALLAAHGLMGATSAWGSAAERTLALLGGPSALDALASDGALNVLNLLASRGPYERPSTGRPHPEPLEAWVLGDIAGQVGTHSSVTRAAVIPALDRLVRSGLVLLGARVECERCGSDYWRAVDDLRSEMTCTGCRAPVYFGAMSGRAGGLEHRWEYRLNEVMAWILDQGVIPGLLARRCISRDARARASLLLGQQLSGAEVLGEIDIVGALDRRPMVAEVKEGANLGEAEVLRTLAIADRLRATAYFATTAHEWDEASADLLSRMTKDRDKGSIRTVVRSELLS